MMDRDAFNNELCKARELRKVGKKPEYWTGYMHGLRRRFLRDDFGTLQEHHLWLTANGTLLRKLRSQGYRDGYGCRQNDGRCATCSLIRDLRDCNDCRI
jgi:hypothetical protein